MRVQKVKDIFLTVIAIAIRCLIFSIRSAPNFISNLKGVFKEAISRSRMSLVNAALFLSFIIGAVLGLITNDIEVAGVAWVTLSIFIISFLIIGAISEVVEERWFSEEIMTKFTDYFQETLALVKEKSIKPRIEIDNLTENANTKRSNHTSILNIFIDRKEREGIIGDIEEQKFRMKKSGHSNFYIFKWQLGEVIAIVLMSVIRKVLSMITYMGKTMINK